MGLDLASVRDVITVLVPAAVTAVARASGIPRAEPETKEIL